MTTSKPYIDLNNEAISQLSDGQTSKAEELLLKALTILRSSLSDTLAPTSIQHSIGYCSNFFDDSAVAKVDISDEFGLDVSPHNEFCFYSRVIRLNKEIIGNAASLFDEPCLIVITLFNLAITNHLHAMIAGKGSELMLMKTLKYYKVTMAACESHTRLHSDSNYQAFTSFICMAVFSNMGHIFSHLCETNEAINCKYCIRSLLYKVIDRKVLSNLEIEEFLWNSRIVTQSCPMA
jgi:hypothetical protein